MPGFGVKDGADFGKFLKISLDFTDENDKILVKYPVYAQF